MSKTKSRKFTLKILIISVTIITIISFSLIYFLKPGKGKTNPQAIVKIPNHEKDNRTNNKIDDEIEPITDYYGEIKPFPIENIIKMDYIDSKLMNKSYWIDKMANDSNLIMSQEEINVFNKKNFATIERLYKVNSYPNNLAGEKVKNYINKYNFPSKTMYDSSLNAIPNSVYKEIKNNINLDSISYTVEIKYGITLTRAPLKSFPSEIEIYNNPITFDKFQETAVEACEKVIILHESKDKKWSFIESYNYRGWIRNKDICKSSLKEINYFTMPKDFITILQNAVELKQGDKHYKYFMGVNLPVEYKENINEPIVYIPTTDSQGKLVKKPVTLDKNLDYCIGYLPLTRENIVEQAFKQLGTKYSWGDIGDGRDCSSFIASVFKTMGIYFPRNTDDQELLNFNSINLKSLSTNDKNKKFDSLKSGDILYLNNHVVMYLGEYNGNKYIIHNSATSRLTTTVDKFDLKTNSGTTFRKLYKKALIIE